MRLRGLVLIAMLATTACQPPTGGQGGTVQRPAAAQPTGVASHSPEVQRLLDAARSAGETELSLAWSQDALGGHEGARQFEAVFNRMYGTNVKFGFTPAPSMTDMAGKISQEVAAEQKASTDVFLGTESHFGVFATRDVLEGYDYTQLSPRISPQIVAQGNIGVEIASIVSGVTYNTDLVAPTDVPKTLDDLLLPKWRGKIASTTNAAIFDRLAARPEWGADRVRDYVTRLSPNVGGLMRCGEIPRIVSGEFAILVLDCGSFFVRQQQAKGAPLAHVIPEDAGTMGFLYLGVPRSSGHPNLAKLFINMVASEDGQKVVWETYSTDHPDLPGSQSAAELQELRAKRIAVLRIDTKFVAEHPDLSRISDDLVRILRTGSGG